MSKISVCLISWFLLSHAVSADAQDSTRSTVVTKDSEYHYPKESFETYTISPPKHQENGFLKRDIAIGGSLGTPGGLNIIAEGYYDRVGLRIEGGAILIIFEIVAGWQADLSYVMARGSDYLIECSAIYFQGVSIGPDDGDTQYKGLGIGLGVTAGAFFLQLGIGHTNSENQYTGVNPNKILVNGLPMSGQLGLLIPLHLANW